MSKHVSKGLRRATGAKEKDAIFAKLRSVMIRMGQSADGEDVADYPEGMSDTTVAEEINVPAVSVGNYRREIYGNFPRKSPVVPKVVEAPDTIESLAKQVHVFTAAFVEFEKSVTDRDRAWGEWQRSNQDWWKSVNSEMAGNLELTIKQTFDKVIGPRILIVETGVKNAMTSMADRLSAVEALVTNPKPPHA